MQSLQRNKEAAQFEEWERQEDNFHLDQARLRSHIRIQDGRGKNNFKFNSTHIFSITVNVSTYSTNFLMHQAVRDLLLP